MNAIGRYVAIALLVVCGPAFAQASPTSETTPLRYRIPATVSPEAAAGLGMVYGYMQKRSEKPPLPQSVEDFDRQAAQIEAFMVPLAQRIIEPLNVSLRDDKLGDVPVVRITPHGYTKQRQILIFAHGGAYVGFSAKSSIVIPAMVANATGYEVISIDYTLAPHGNWKTIPDQVLSVYKAVLAAGYQAKDIGMFGDSAGGGLVAGSVLKMRDLGMPLPGALYLLSPWSDITPTGDTFVTLADADPTLDEKALAANANAYAPPADQTNPYVSPVYGDYAKPFPPTLIQAGTREVLLSACVRLYQAIRNGGHEAVLDVYEGMPHVFQGLAPRSPETKTAIKRAAEFFRSHLGK